MTSALDLAFEAMAERAAYDVLKDGDTLGLGSGSSVAKFATALGKRMKRESLNITVVPSSLQSYLLAEENRLELSKYSAHCPKEIDVAVDGADQIALSTRSMIKGGGGQLLKEKIIISASKKCFILGDESKFLERLTRSVPVEVVQFSYIAAASSIREKLGGDPILRKLDKGYPYYTESGNLVLDCQFREPISDPRRLETQLKMIPGVVESGIFNVKVDSFYRAKKDGSFDVI